MDDLGSISGLDRTGEGGSSYGSYYLPVRQPKKNAEPPKLRQGEIVMASVIEIIEKELARVKLPMGSFKATLHDNLQAGDTLFLYVAQVQPSLILRVHSVSSSHNGKLRPPADIIRILDLINHRLILEIVEFIRKQKSNVLRNEIIAFADILEKLDYGNKNYSKPALFKSIFYVKLADAKDDIDLIKSFYPAFFDIADIYSLIAKIRENPTLNAALLNDFKTLLLLNQEKNIIDLSSDNSLIRQLDTNNASNDLNVFMKIIDSISAFNRFAIANRQHIIWLFALPIISEFCIFRMELLAESKQSYQQSQISEFSNFIAVLEENNPELDKILRMENMEENIDERLKLLSDFFAKNAHKFAFALTSLISFCPKYETKVIMEGNVKATPINFSIVV